MMSDWTDSSSKSSIGRVRQFIDNVQLENMYQLNCKIAVDIAEYAFTMFSVLGVVLIQPHTTYSCTIGSDDYLLK